MFRIAFDRLAVYEMMFIIILSMLRHLGSIMSCKQIGLLFSVVRSSLDKGLTRNSDY